MFQTLLSSISNRFHDVTLQIQEAKRHRDGKENVKSEGDEKFASNYFGDISVLLPNSWISQTECLHGRNVTQAESNILFNKVKKYHADFMLGPPHPIFGSEPWSRQFGGCTVPGQGVMIPYTLLTDLDEVKDETNPEPRIWMEKYSKAGK